MFFRQIIGNCRIISKTFRLDYALSKRHHSTPTSTLVTLNTKMNYEENTAYLRYRPEEKRFETTFLFETDGFTFNKPVCVVRPVDESVESYLSKINHKIGQLLEKKILKKKRKKGEEEPVELPEVSSKFYQNDKEITDISLKALFEGPPGDDFKLKILDIEYKIAINSPWIESIRLPSEIYAGFIIFPIKFDAQCTDKKLSEFTWFKSDEKTTKKLSWVECGKGFWYKPKQEDEGHLLLLQCIPKNEYSTGPSAEIMSKPVITFDRTCPFEKRHTYTQTKTNPDEIRVVSYNILADVYAETKEAINNLFSFCKQEYLSMSYRRPLIIKELEGYNADLICLQELDATLYCRLDELFETLNFGSEYYEKGSAREGTAIFFSNEKFKMIKSLHHMLSDDIEKHEALKDLYEKIKSNEKLLFRLKRLGTTLQILVLQSLVKPDEIFLVGNTHLYFHPDADHIRLLQGVMTVKLLEAHFEEIKKENPDKNVNIIVCGDFNSVPQCGIYQLMTKGSVDSSHIDWESNKEEAIKDVSHSHPLKIESACGTPKYTNYTHLFKDCLDYIYYQTDRLEVKHVVPFPTEEELSKDEAIPSAVFPSDHVALVADLKWKN